MATERMVQCDGCGMVVRERFHAIGTQHRSHNGKRLCGTVVPSVEPDALDTATVRAIRENKVAIAERTGLATSTVYCYAASSSEYGRKLRPRILRALREVTSSHPAPGGAATDG